MDWFKTMTTSAYIHGVKEQSWLQFTRKLWQRSYYDHVIRNEEDYQKVRSYIIANPVQWAIDEENPTQMN